MVNKVTNISEDGGCSGATAFFSFGWSDNNSSKTIEYKEFTLNISLSNFRTDNQMWSRQKILIADWKNSVEAQLAKYDDAKDYNDYLEKKRKAEKESAELKPKEEVPYDSSEGEFKKLFDEIKEIKADKSKPLEIKEKDMQAIMEKIDAKNKEEIERINERVEKQEEQNLRIAQEIKNAQQAGNKALEAKLIAALKKGKEDAAAINSEKKEVVNNEIIKELLKEEQNTSWQFNLKSGRTWGFVSLTLIILFLVVFLFTLIYKKIRDLLK